MNRVHRAAKVKTNGKTNGKAHGHGFKALPAGQCLMQGRHHRRPVNA